MSTLLKDRNGRPFTVESATSDGTQTVVVMHFGTSAQRTFSVTQWEALDALMRELLEIEGE